MQNSTLSVLSAQWTVSVCICVFVHNRDLTSFSPCKPQNEFSLWRCFVGYTLNSESLKAHSLNNYLFFSSRALLSAPLIISPSFILSLRYYIIISQKWSPLQTSVPVCCCIHTAVSVLFPAVRSNPCLRAYSLYRLDLNFDPTTFTTWNYTVKQPE